MAKGTAMMGGVQVFNILINLIRGKLVALFLGPQGMGVMSLLQSSGNMVQQISAFGLNLSSVKEVAGANDDNRNHIIAVIRKVLLASSLIGVVAMIALSSTLSRFSFGNSNYIWAYIFLSIWLFFNTLSNGELSILQGAHALKRLAYSSLVGSLTGLLIGVPLFYFFGEKGIVPALIASSLSGFIFYRYQSLKQFGHISLGSVVLSQEWLLVKKLVTLGAIFMISSLLGTITTYAINLYVRSFGSIGDVGLFQAANSLTNQYAGLVFTAMGMDFFPRLSAASSDKEKIRSLVNQQMEIVLLVVAPIVSLIIVFAPLIVLILLTDEFLTIVPVIQIMAVSIFFKSIAYPMGYISFATGDKKVFFWLEGVCGNLVHLALSIVFYSLWGVTGLGIAMGAGYFVYIFIYLVVTRLRYDYRPNIVVLKLILPLTIALAAIYSVSFIENDYLSYSLRSILAIGLICFSLIQLNRRLDIKSIIKSRFRGGI